MTRARNVPVIQPQLCTPETSVETAKALYQILHDARLHHPDPSSRYVADQMAAFFEIGFCGSLDGALGFKSHGGVSVRRSLAIESRDKLLRSLASTFAEWQGRDAGQVARLMRKAFERYESGQWLRDRNRPAAPAVEPYTTFWRILHGGAPMPQLRHLMRIL